MRSRPAPWPRPALRWGGCPGGEDHDRDHANPLKFGLQSLRPPTLALGTHSLGWEPTVWEPTISRTTDFGSGDALTGLGAYSLGA